MPGPTPVPAQVRRLSAGVLAAALLIPVTATAPAQAVTLSVSQEQTVGATTADTKAPGLSSITRTSPEVAGPDESVRLQWTSEATDISHVYVSFTNETGQTLYAYAYPGEDLVINLDPQKTTTGTYRLNYAYVQDVTGIQTQYQGDGRVSTYPSAATPPPTVNLNLDALTFTVEGTAADTKAPGLSSITRTSPEVAGPDESVRLQWTSEATDISHVYVSFTNETGQTLYAYAYPGEDLVINLDPQKTTTGTYRLNYAYVQDVTGIQTQYQGDGRVSTYPSAATPPPTVNLNLDALTFTVEGTAADTKAPGLSSITRTSPEVAGPDESVRLQWTSEATDISHVYVSFTNETGQTLYAYAYPGEDLVINLDPQKTTTGTYRLNYAYVQDVTGIQTQYQGDGRVSTYPSAATPPPTVNLNLDALTFTVEVASHEVTPAAVVFTDEDGTAADTYTIPDTEGVDYLVDGTATAPGTYPATGTVTVTARAKTDYVLADGADTSWSNTFATTMAVTPAAPVFTDKPSTYTIPATTGVQYYVNGAGTAPGTYKAKGTGTVKITARAQDGYVLTEDATTSWKQTFKKSPTHVTPGTVIFTDEKGTAADTYTIPDTEGVGYLVNGTVTAPGTYPGTGTVKIKTKAQTGYVVNSPGTWKITFKR